MEGLLTVNQAARKTGKDPETIRRWIWKGRLRSQKIGGQHFIAAEDLDAAAHKKAPLMVAEPQAAYAVRPAPQESFRTVVDVDEKTDEELWQQLDAEEAESEAYKAAHPEEFPQTYEELMQRIAEAEAERRAWREANKHKSLEQLEKELHEGLRKDGYVPGNAADDIREMRALRDAQILRAAKGL